MSAATLDEDRLYHLLGRFQARYANTIDNDALETWPDFFTEDCQYVVTTAGNHRRGLAAGLIYADSKGMLRDRVAALREANIYEQHTYRHMVGQPLVGAAGDGEISAETGFVVVRIMHTGETELYVSGRYIDQYRLVEGELKLSKRIVVCDSHAIDTLLALPL